MVVGFIFYSCDNGGCDRFWFWVGWVFVLALCLFDDDGIVAVISFIIGME